MREETATSSTTLAILIPAHNCQQTVGETLASLQAVDRGWEQVDRVVICDDASSDDTVAEIKKTRFSRCRLVVLSHPRNRGEGNCYRTMLASLPAAIDWFLILHADDLALSNFIERNLEIIRRSNDKVAAVSSSCFVFNSTKEWRSQPREEDIIVLRGGSREHLEHTALVGTWWHISGSLVNRRLWEDHGGRDPEVPHLGDWDLMLKWQRNGYYVGHSLISTTKHRVSDQSMSSRSHFDFTDIWERAFIVKRHSAVFTRAMRWRLAVWQAKQAGRRILKFALQRNWKIVRTGALTTVRAVSDILW